MELNLITVSFRLVNFGILIIVFWRAYSRYLKNKIEEKISEKEALKEVLKEQIVLAQDALTLCEKESLEQARLEQELSKKIDLWKAVHKKRLMAHEEEHKKLQVATQRRLLMQHEWIVRQREQCHEIPHILIKAEEMLIEWYQDEARAKKIINDIVHNSERSV